MGRRIKNPKKYWYHTTIYECPVCWRQEICRERRYTPKPKKIEDRYEYKTHYDWCEG